MPADPLFSGLEQEDRSDAVNTIDTKCMVLICVFLSPNLPHRLRAMCRLTGHGNTAPRKDQVKIDAIILAWQAARTPPAD
jgi:hypothetical protein